MAAVRILHEIKVSPFPSLPSQPPQPLSFLDSIWLQNSKLVERLFFFDFPTISPSHFIEHNLPIFTKSLAVTLHHFYPLAGSIRRSPDSDDQFEIAYEEGDSVSLTIAEFAGDDFRIISGHQPRNIKKLRLLVPKPAKTSSGNEFPPISIRITLFPNQGLCIGFAINHAACDGSGSMQFIRSWADSYRSAELTLDSISPAILDRSIIIDTCNMRQKIFKMALLFNKIYEENLKKQHSLPLFDPSLVSATFTLSKYQIERLKERVQAKGAKEGKPSFHISSFSVTCAYVWNCLVKARGYDNGVNQCFGCVVDWRARMKPPIPSNYFGNCLGNFFTELKAGELAGKDGIEVAAMAIGKSIDGLKGRDVVDVLESAFNTYLKLAGSRLLTVAGSPKLKVYEVDFGWGRPVKVEVTSIVETGAMSLAESRKEKGGMEIGLVLSEEEMNKFGMNYAIALLDL